MPTVSKLLSILRLVPQTLRPQIAKIIFEYQADYDGERKILRDATAMVYKLQWLPLGATSRYCPECNSSETNGHAPSCRIKKLINSRFENGADYE